MANQRRVDFPLVSPGSSPPSGSISIWEDDNPNAMLNKVRQDKFKIRATEARIKSSELFGMSEAELLQTLRKRCQDPDPRDHQIRIKLWMEYENSIATGKPMRLEYAYGAFMEVNYFYEKYLTAPQIVAWLLCPPTAYNVKIEEALHAGINQMRELLSLPITRPDGSFNAKIAELQIKVYALLDSRVHGSFKQTIESKSVTMNLSEQSKTKELSMEEIDQRLSKLMESEGRRLKKLDAIAAESPAIEVLPKEGTPE